MQDNTEVTPMRDIIEQRYQNLRPRLATQDERAAIDAFYQRIKLAEDTDAVVEAYHAQEDQFATKAEHDAVSGFCQGICSYYEPYDYDEDDYGYPDSILPDWPYNEDGSIVQGYNADGSLAEPLPDEFFLHGTSYVVLPPAEDDALTAVATAIRELSAEDDDAIDLEDPNDYAYVAYMQAIERVDSDTGHLLCTLISAQKYSDGHADAVWEAKVAEAAEEVLKSAAAYAAIDVNENRGYDFLRTLHSSGLALEFEQALAQAAEHVAAE